LRLEEVGIGELRMEEKLESGNLKNEVGRVGERKKLKRN